jgi:hypothetical protein
LTRTKDVKKEKAHVLEKAHGRRGERWEIKKG